MSRNTPCPADTDGDGNCGRRMCPQCSPYAEHNADMPFRPPSINNGSVYEKARQPGFTQSHIEQYIANIQRDAYEHMENVIFGFDPAPSGETGQSCPDCTDGKYHGLNAAEECRTCGGTGRI